jgi:hypothetical protein
MSYREGDSEIDGPSLFQDNLNGQGHLSMNYMGPFVSWLGTLAVGLSVPALLQAIRKRPELHLRFFLVGARFGKVYFPVVGSILGGSAVLWTHTNRYFNHWLWETSMWTYAAAGVAIFLVGKLGTFRVGNAALTWRGPVEAGMHLTAERMTARETRSFMQTAPSLWLKAQSLGFRRVRMLSPLLGDPQRCQRFAELMRAHASSNGFPCEIEYIEPQTWNWFVSLLYFLRHDRKSKSPEKLAMPWHQRVFRVQVGGFRLIARKTEH